LWLPNYAKSIGVLIREINGEPDHIHMLLELTPQDTLGNVIGALKARSSRALHERFKFPMYWGKHLKTLWSEGYFVVSAGGTPLETIKKYIQNQTGSTIA
jgi:putative transposase